jgi:hypothetical protein
MKVEYSKEWCERMASREQEVGANAAAGLLPVDRGLSVPQSGSSVQKPSNEVVHQPRHWPGSKSLAK